jgi:hypothetical protein
MTIDDFAGMLVKEAESKAPQSKPGGAGDMSGKRQ